MNCLIYGNEPELLREICKGKHVLEIGAYEGGSTCIIAEVAKSITSIDTFNSDCILGYVNKDTLGSYLKNTKRFSNVKHIVGNSKEVVYTEPYDILFIDGDHTYEGCMNDLQRFSPKEGYLLHDYGMLELFPGVMAAAMNYFGRFPDKRADSLAYWKNLNT